MSAYIEQLRTLLTSPAGKGWTLDVTTEATAIESAGFGVTDTYVRGRRYRLSHVDGTTADFHAYQSPSPTMQADIVEWVEDTLLCFQPKSTVVVQTPMPLDAHGWELTTIRRKYARVYRLTHVTGEVREHVVPEKFLYDHPQEAAQQVRDWVASIVNADDAMNENPLLPPDAQGWNLTSHVDHASAVIVYRLTHPTGAGHEWRVPESFAFDHPTHAGEQVKAWCRAIIDGPLYSPTAQAAQAANSLNGMGHALASVSSQAKLTADSFKAMSQQAAKAFDLMGIAVEAVGDMDKKEADLDAGLTQIAATYMDALDAKKWQGLAPEAEAKVDALLKKMLSKKPALQGKSADLYVFDDPGWNGQELDLSQYAGPARRLTRPRPPTPEPVQAAPGVRRITLDDDE